MSVANTVERQMLDLINAERAEAGLDPVKLNLLLNDSSEDHSQWMLNNDQFSHTGAGGSSAHDRMEAANYPFEGSWTSGENIAWQSERGADGIADDVVQLHQGLMDSPGHRANILNPDYTEIGIGIERGDFEGFDGVVVTQNFARTDGDTSGSLEPDTGSNPEPTPEPTPPVAEVPSEPTPSEPMPPVAEVPSEPTPTPVEMPIEPGWCDTFTDAEQDEDVFEFAQGGDAIPSDGDPADAFARQFSDMIELFFQNLPETAPQEAADTTVEIANMDQSVPVDCWAFDFA